MRTLADLMHQWVIAFVLSLSIFGAAARAETLEWVGPLVWDVGFFGAGVWIEQATGRPTPMESFPSDGVDRAFHRHVDPVWGSGSYGSGQRSARLSLASDSAFLSTFALAMVGSGRAKKWNDLRLVVHGAAFNDFATKGLKAWFGRPRPYATRTDQDSFDAYRSFPSGHSSHAFLAATMCTLLADPCAPFAPWAWGTAALTAYLRIAANKHHLTDVVAGGALGAASAVFTYHVFRGAPTKGHEVAFSGGSPTMLQWELRW